MSNPDPNDNFDPWDYHEGVNEGRLEDSMNIDKHERDSYESDWMKSEKEYRFTFKTPSLEKNDEYGEALEFQINVKATNFPDAYGSAANTAKHNIRGVFDLRGVYVC